MAVGLIKLSQGRAVASICVENHGQIRLGNFPMPNIKSLLLNVITLTCWKPAVTVKLETQTMAPSQTIA